MNEYPIPIASGPSNFDIQLVNGEIITHHWDLMNVSEGVYQLRGLNHLDDVMGTRSYHINQVMDDFRQIYGNRATFQVIGNGRNFHYVSDILPGEQDIYFMLRVWAHSQPFYDDGRMLDFCDECEIDVPSHNGEEHEECVHCGEWTASATMEGAEVHGLEHYETLACRSCNRGGYGVGDLDSVITCNSCNEHYQESNSRIDYRNVIGQGMGYYCDDCSESLLYCDGCDRFGDDDNMTEDDYGEVYCLHCRPQLDESLIKEWNYRPEMNFHPPIPVNPLKPLYIGMELEIQWESYQYDATEWLEMVRDQFCDFMYVKSDSSIDEGFELVTHPMSPEFMLENFPWSILHDAIDQGADERHHSTGVHIHVDRGALTTAQMWKLLKVHQKQEELCGIIGGRGTNTDYANWKDMDPVNENMMRIARRKGEAYGLAARYVPVNLQNEDTIELRYMEGTINPGEIKKNIQWVQALYDFTDHISVEDVKNGVLESPGYLLGWITDQQAIYPDLSGYLTKRIMAPAPMPARSLVCA